MSDISVLAELERIGWEYAFSGSDEVKVRCPFHDDKNPSASINVQTLKFACHTAGCREKGDFVKFLCGALKSTRVVVYADLSTRYTLDETKTIDPDFVERCHDRIWSAGPLLLELRKRGVTDKIIKKYRLGEDKGRVTIPIMNEGGLWVNIRRYLPGAPGPDKMRNAKGFGRIRLTPIDQLKYDEIVLCGGEIKAYVAAEQLNRHNVGAISHTGGEGNWEPSLSKNFQGKKVYVCCDIDEEGQRAAKDWCTRLFHVARWVGNLKLPLSIETYPHGDINDYVCTENGSLKRLLNGVERFQLDITRATTDDDAMNVELCDAILANKAGKRMSWKAVVTAIDTAPYIIPKHVKINCDHSQTMCALCPVFISKCEEMTIHPESQAILAMINTKRSTQVDAIKQGLGIPTSCRVVEFEPLEFYNAEDVRISPQLEITNRSADRVMQPAVAIGDKLELNESYNMIGRMHPHPASQQSTLLVSSYTACLDALSTYTPGNVDHLKVFQPTDWSKSALEVKLESIYTDLAANVTRIFQRQDIHLAVDLSYFSPLLINFDGKVAKGWVETLILGDSSQGKTETTVGLQRHYQLGEKIECKNATVAGLLGGLQQMSNKWFVTWGVIPTHDKRLVILEELKGASVDVIGKLTDMRSSGIAEIPKIEKRRTHARTRLIALSNPRSNMPLRSYNFGIEAIKELIGNLEDVRRFDFCLLVGQHEIDAERLNQLQSERPKVDHVFTTALCRELVLWTWTRSHEQVVFESEAYVLKRAIDLCKMFSEQIPVVDSGSMRLKLARLSAAIAARTFSTDDGLTLIVRNCHVEYIADMLTRVYSSNTFGYLEFTAAVNKTNMMTDSDKILTAIKDTPFPKDLAEQLLNTVSIDLSDIQDWCGWDRFSAQQFLSLLVRKGALRRGTRKYHKTPPFITLLKSAHLENRPAFIEDF